jgi:phenylacetic acid degradation operon negative regulatory protein
MEQKDTSAKTLVAELKQAVRLRANPAIITIFGDTVLPHGGNLWLGSLISLAAPLGIAPRLVRTGVYRLSKQGWLTSQKRGRRAYYSIAEQSLDKFHEATRRFYAVENTPWDGEWRLVQLPSDLTSSQRQALVRELGWLGFGQIGPALYAHPTEKTATIARTLARHKLNEKSFVFRAHLADFVSGEHVHRVARQAWNLSALNSDYGRFIDTFSPIREALASGAPICEADAYTLRILLMLEHRRILLKDPVLPEALLPADWLGTRARDVTVDIYRRIVPPADRFLLSHMETWSGTVPLPPPEYWQRFGGIAPREEERVGAPA